MENFITNGYYFAVYDGYITYFTEKLKNWNIFKIKIFI